MAIQEVLVSKIFNYTSEPTKKVEGQFWFNPSTNVLSRYNGTVWKPISVSSDDVVVLSSGNKVSLTNYLNTQIAALAEGIDSKQDKLKFYTEVDKSGDTSTYSTGSEINLKTSSSQYGGSNINLIASNGQYNPGNINLKAKAWDTSNGSYITLESEGGSASGGNITLHSKVNTGGSAEPGGRIEIIADGSSAQATNNPGAGIITLNAKDGSFLNGNESITFEGTINLNATKVQKNGADIATATDLAAKQNTLQFYIESGEGPTSTAKITAYNFEVSSAQIKLDSEYGIDGNILEKTISKTSSDTKIPTAKAIYTAIDAIKPTYYSEYTSSSDEYAKISIDKTSINVSESGGIILTAGNSADPGNIKLGLNPSSFILDSTSSMIGNTTNLLTIQSNVRDGSISSLSGDLISKSITSSSTDTQLPTAKAIKTELDKKQNKLEGYSEILPENGGVETIKIVTNTGDDSLTLQSRKLIFNGDISGTGISTSIPALASSVNTKIPSEKAVRTELNKKQDALYCYSETTSGEAIISNATSFSINGTSDGLIVENNNGGITIRGNLFKAGQGAISLATNAWNDGSAILFDYEGQGVAVSDALMIPEIKNKQNSTDNTLETIDKTIVGAINEINSIFNVNALPTPITDVKTITTTLENLITDTQYANKPGTILINPNIKNTGAILVGEAITDISKAFPIYTDQPVTIAFKNINDFKVAGENAGESFNYIISFGYINQSISTNA